MRGDVLFYTPYDLIGHLVAWWTNGPFCHAEVDIGAGESIAAHSKGVERFTRTRGDALRIGAIWHPPTSAGLDIERGIAWLQQQVGERYGWEDIYDAAATGLHKRVRQLRLPELTERMHYDCSDLCTRYLIACGYHGLPNRLVQEPHLVTPNDLWRALPHNGSETDRLIPAAA